MPIGLNLGAARTAASHNSDTIDSHSIATEVQEDSKNIILSHVKTINLNQNKNNSLQPENFTCVSPSLDRSSGIGTSEADSTSHRKITPSSSKNSENIIKTNNSLARSALQRSQSFQHQNYTRVRQKYSILWSEIFNFSLKSFFFLERISTRIRV